MKKRRHTPEQVVRKLAEGEKLLAQAALLAWQAQLRALLVRASDLDGDIAKCCSRAAAIASISLLRKGAPTWTRFAPRHVVEHCEAALGRIGISRLERICTAEIERLVGGFDFSLVTERVTESLGRRRQRSRTFLFEGVERGSMNELSLQASLRSLIEQVHLVAAAIETSPGTVLVRVECSPGRMSRLVRRTVWATCSIDWVQTFIDITGAPCWKDDDPGALRVPWFVAAALDEARALEGLSATRGEPPIREDVG